MEANVMRIKCTYNIYVVTYSSHKIIYMCSMDKFDLYSGTHFLESSSTYFKMFRPASTETRTWPTGNRFLALILQMVILLNAVRLNRSALCMHALFFFSPVCIFAFSILAVKAHWAIHGSGFGKTDVVKLCICGYAIFPFMRIHTSTHTHTHVGLYERTT